MHNEIAEIAQNWADLTYMHSKFAGEGPPDPLL